MRHSAKGSAFQLGRASLADRGCSVEQQWPAQHPTGPTFMRGISPLLVACAVSAVGAIPRPALAVEWEGDLAAGPAFSNAGSQAVALQGRAGVSFSHASLSLRALDVLGNSYARFGKDEAFSAWLAVAELRLHTGQALGAGRLHLALGAGLGREIQVSRGSTSVSPSVSEEGQTGPTFLVSAGGALKTGPLALSFDVAGFYWTTFETTSATRLYAGANGGLGAALLFGIGILP